MVATLVTKMLISVTPAMSVMPAIALGSAIAVQLVRGDMSMVGPRPPLPAEVELYEHHVTRRLLVKPGITGLWQVSGRSDLSWDEAVRLDLYYVDHWSPTMDAAIIAKTFSAVVRGSGAY